MNSCRRLDLTFKPTFNHVHMVRIAICGICADYFQIDCHSSVIMDFCLIVTELLNNAVEHSTAEILEAEISLEGMAAVFSLTTVGPGFDPTRRVTMPDVEKGDLPEGGFGLALMQTLADGIEYEYDEKRNRVTLRKNFSNISAREMNVES